MKCNEIRELLSLYIDRMLGEDQSKAVEEHLSACEACRKEYNEMKEMIDLLGQIEMLAIPDAFRFRLKKALIEEKQDMINAGMIKNPSKKKNQWRILTSVAAVFAVGVLSFGLYHDVLGIFPNQLDGTEQTEMAQPKMAEPDAIEEMENNNLYSAELEDQESTKGDFSDESLSMKQQTPPVSEDREPEMITYDAAGGSEPEQNTASDGTDSSGILPKSMPTPAQEDCSRSLTVSGIERNAAAVQYYDNLIAEKLQDFDYQVLESSYSKTGEWHFRIFIFRGKDGNTYNEEILIIGKDGEISILYSNEFMRL